MDPLKLTAVFAAAALVLFGSINDAHAHGHGAGQAKKHVQAQHQRGSGKEEAMQSRSAKADRARQKIRRDIDDEDIYGRQMMSAEERRAYRQRLNAASSDKEWAQIREEHQTEIRARAQAQGREIEPPVYGQHIISAEERRRFTSRLQAAATDAEREQIRNEHREMIRDRAREMGVEVPPTS